MIACPGCGGNLRFSPQLQQLHCSYCDNNYDPYAFDNKSKDGIEVEKDEFVDDSYETTIFTCPECGGEIESTDNEATGFCPFCGGSTIFYSRLSREKKPDYVIPFIKTKEDCKNAYAKRAKRALFLPKEYKDPKFIDGFRGIYMPYWSYDVDQVGPYALSGEKSYRRGDYIYTSHYALTGEIDAFYHGYSHDASSSFSDDISEGIAPFNVKEKKKFTAGYLSGFYADTADVDALVYANEAREFANDETFKQIKRIPTYSGIAINTKTNAGRISSMITQENRTMFPVWFMSYRFDDKRVTYATVNGQTGKVFADFPIDIKKYLGFAAIISAVLFLLMNFMLTIKPNIVSGWTAALSVVALILFGVEHGKIKARETAQNDRGLSSKRSNRQKNKANGYKTPIFPIVMGVAACVISGIAFFSDTINDEVHYIASLISSICIAVTLIYLIKDYNMLSTRRLPQFDKKGGDDSAE